MYQNYLYLSFTSATLNNNKVDFSHFFSWIIYDLTSLPHIPWKQGELWGRHYIPLGNLFFFLHFAFSEFLFTRIFLLFPVAVCIVKIVTFLYLCCLSELTFYQHILSVLLSVWKHSDIFIYYYYSLLYDFFPLRFLICLLQCLQDSSNILSKFFL